MDESLHSSSFPWCKHYHMVTQTGQREMRKGKLYLYRKVSPNLALSWVIGRVRFLCSFMCLQEIWNLFCLHYKVPAGFLCISFLHPIFTSIKRITFLNITYKWTEILIIKSINIFLMGYSGLDIVGPDCMPTLWDTVVTDTAAIAWALKKL